jgi:Metallo-beta-lactamase superfamily
MWIERIQYAVGQGGFHAAHVHSGHSPEERGDATYSYVYDCGSNSRVDLRQAIARFSAATSRLNALFVSHLDEDHVNGLDHLLTTTDVEDVYIPYLDDLLVLLDLLEIESTTGLTGSLVEAALDPAGFFGRRGVQRVIRLGSGGASGLDGPQLPQPSGGSTEEGDFISKPTREHGRVSKGIVGKRAELLNMSPDGAIGLEIGPTRLDWMLLPHVTPAPQENMVAFRKAIRGVLGLASGKKLTARCLIEGLTRRSTRQDMKKCYEAIVAGGARRAHNRISMSLYSGPTGYADHGRWRQVICRPYSTYEPRYWLFAAHGPVGWLGTGDATLKDKKVWESFDRNFRKLWPEVAVLVLPHHGSAHNFNAKLLCFSRLGLAVANAGIPSPYGHPSLGVVRQIEAAGARFWQVSQNASSELREWIWQGS